MCVKKMGKKSDKAQGKSVEVSKRGSKKGKEVQFPPPKCGPTDQTTPLCQGAAWKMSTMKESAI